MFLMKKYYPVRALYADYIVVSKAFAPSFLLFPRQDCDNNDDCVRGLVCFQRDGVENNVPGCLLGEAVEDVDYCVLPSQNFGVLTYIGDTGPFGTCGGVSREDKEIL